MLSLELATALRDAGLAWKPAPGDRFAMPDRGLDDQTFVLSDMTIQVHELPKGTVIGFNGTTEWALDDVAKDEAIWLPAEDQLRNLLGGTFRRLERGEDGYQVVTSVLGREQRYAADTPEDAYAHALLALIAAGRD
ncbi:MAG: pilus assembly protein CpaE [Micromonosporaceae bacterium]|nr:pilus assembly protein CpaE [Micromonosporaceae bacterium]